MPHLPTLRSHGAYTTTTDQFFGLDRRLKAPDGTFSAMRNLSGEDYPVLSTRHYRGNVATLKDPRGMIAKDALAWVDGSTLFYNGMQVQDVVLSESGEKQLVSMGAYLIIWPDKYYVNTADLSDHGHIEVRNAVDASSVPVTYTVCNQEGEDYSDPVASSEPPETPENGAVWIDISSDPHTLKQYSADASSWVSIPTVYVKISASNIGIGLKALDGVTISGASVDVQNPDVAAQVEVLNGTVIVYATSKDYIVVTGLLDQVVEQNSGTVNVSRTAPDMDFITEASNRLWGCKYGLVNGKPVNELYCCALGDFRNWNQYLGLSTDSWTASQGTDGVFTGAITHMGHPLFFKENSLHKVTISSSGAHGVNTTICRGVQKGSHKSLVVVDEFLYYKSRADICVYDGSLPVSVSEALWDERYYDAVAGAYAGRYHISMRDSDYEWHELVYDTSTRLWHEEDDLHVLHFSQMDDDLYCIDKDGNLIALYGTEGTPETDIDWSADTSIIGFEYPEQLRLSRYNIRLDLPEGSTMDVYVQYDSSGDWMHVHHMEGDGLGSILIPVIPRRCDHLQIRMEGTGQARIYTFTKKLAFAGERRYRP